MIKLPSAIFKIALPLVAGAMFLGASHQAAASGLTLYGNGSYGGWASSEFSGPSNTTSLNKYNTSTFSAHGATADAASSAKLSSGYQARLWDSDAQSGGDWGLDANATSLGSFDNKTTSVMVWKKAAGVTTLSASSGLTTWQPGFITGDWLIFGRDNWAQLKSSGGESHYAARYEIEYWVNSGAYLGPLVQTISGTNVKVATSGSVVMGTCTGSAPAHEEYWRLNGECKWTNRERYTGYGCSYNVALRDEW